MSIVEDVVLELKELGFYVTYAGEHEVQLTHGDFQEDLRDSINSILWDLGYVLRNSPSDTDFDHPKLRCSGRLALWWPQRGNRIVIYKR